MGNQEIPEIKVPSHKGEVGIYTPTHHTPVSSNKEE